MITQDQIKNWFAGVKNFLINENCVDILDDSRHILNCDETGMNTCPKTGKVLCLKQMPNFFKFANGPEKEHICWYKKEYVMQSIKPPKLVNARKVYAVPGINNYKIQLLIVLLKNYIVVVYNIRSLKVCFYVLLS